MTLTSKLERIANELASIEGLKLYHYWRPHLEAPYAIWYEESESESLEANNHKAEQSIHGFLDYFTKQEFDEMVDIIQYKLNEIENLGWELSFVQYEDETNLIHYTWEFYFA